MKKFFKNIIAAIVSGLIWIGQLLIAPFVGLVYGFKLCFKSSNQHKISYYSYCLQFVDTAQGPKYFIFNTEIVLLAFAYIFGVFNKRARKIINTKFKIIFIYDFREFIIWSLGDMGYITNKRKCDELASAIAQLKEYEKQKSQVKCDGHVVPVKPVIDKFQQEFNFRKDIVNKSFDYLKNHLFFGYEKLLWKLDSDEAMPAK